MKKIITGMGLLFVLTIIPGTIHAQKKITKTLQARTIDASRPVNPNINPGEDSTLARGPYCEIYVSNFTGYQVKIYVDRYYRGQLAAGRGGKIIVPAGYKVIYCVSTGGTKEWSGTGNCRNSYTFKIYP